MPPFHLRILLDHADCFEIVLHTLDQSDAELLVRHLPSAKPERHLALITLVEEPGQVPQFDLVVAFVCARTELDLFDDDLLLLKLRLVPPLAFPVLEFAEIHDTANRGHRGRCDFHKIKLCRFRLRIGDRNRD